MKTGVLVVGAGPAGLACALALREAGLPALVVESRARGRSKPCGGFLNPLALRLLQRMESDDILRQTGSVTIRSLVLTIGHRISEHPFPGGMTTQAVDRRAFDQALWDLAVSRGADIRPEEPLKELQWGKGGTWQVRTRSLEIEAETVVAADGMNSAVDRLGGGGERPAGGRYGIQYHFAAPPDIPASVGLHFAPGGYIGTCLSAPGLLDCSAILQRTGTRPPPGPREAWEHFVAHSGWLREHVAPLKPVGDPVVIGNAWPSGVRPNRPGLVRAGDARRFWEPFTGQGITHALFSGWLAGRCLAGVGDGPERRHASIMALYDERTMGFNRLLGGLLARPGWICRAAPLFDVSGFLVRHGLSCVLDKPAADPDILACLA